MRLVIGAYVGTLAALVIFVAAGVAVVVHDTGPANAIEADANAHSFNIFTWELRHFPEKWLYRIGNFFHYNGKGPDDQVLQRYFNLTTEEARLQDRDPNSPDLPKMEEERAWLENTVEDIIDGRVTAILNDQGLTMGPPPFTDMNLVFPPVDFEFDEPPRVLVISPRDKIEIQHYYLLSPGINLDTVQQIEADAEKDGKTSALVVQTGGFSTYPSVVPNLDNYDNLIEIVCHEWTHAFLSFYPLGLNYYRSPDLKTLNETAATISGQELAKLYFQRYGRLDLSASAEPAPSPSARPAPGATPAPTPVPYDFDAQIQALRLQVQDQLSQGKVDDAEALMNQKRDEFAQHGHYVRKLNQAYFAFHGSYATTSSSIDPIGPKMQQLFKDAGSDGEFLRRVRGITTQAELDQLLSTASG
jgi:hypothetical protein